MNTAQTTKNLAQKIARQMAQEPLEVLKTAREQVIRPDNPPKKEQEQEQQKIDQNQNELIDKTKSTRRIEAFNRELKDIERDRIFKELQRKISEGLEVYLEEYPELSMEQKQVLKAQMEAVHTRDSRFKNQDSSLVEPAAKKGRRLFNFGKKREVMRQQTRVENIVPPSG